MATTIKTGWLKDSNGNKFAAKTLISQVQTNDGVLLEDKIQADLNATKTEILDEVIELNNSNIAPHTHDDRYYTESEIDTKIASVNIAISEKADSSHTHAISDVTNLQSSLDEKVPTSRTVNGKALTADITLSASDVGAAASSHTHSSYVNQNAFSNVKVGSTTVAADTTTDTLEVAAGTGISVSGDATNDKITITNSGVRSISTGSSNGTISVNTNGTSANVAVKGLGSAAYTASTAYDASGTAQTKADAALASAKSYTDTQISNLINGAPTTLDTLGEIATAMEENADVVTALEDAIGTKVDKVSGKGLSTNDYTTTEKNKLAGIDSGAQVNQNAFSNVKVGSTTIAADTTTDTLTLVAGDNITLTPDATGDSVTIAAKDTTYTLSSFGVTATAAELNKLDGVTATATEINYVDGVTSNIQTQLDGKASSSHTHNYAGSSSAGGAATSANKVNSSLTVKLNGGSTEGTNLFTFNGSAAKSVNITPSAIGAATSSHTHDDRYYTETEIDTKLSGKADTSHGNHVPATETANNAKFLRNDNTWQTVTPANIGAAASSHSHTITASASDDDVVVLTGTNGTNKVTYSASHANSGVTAGTYKSVTVNAKGHVTSGSNPTTLSGYGITNAYTKTEIDSTLAGKSDTGHTHTISNVTNLQSSLDAKVPTSRTINGKALTANISLSASDVGADASGSASAALASAKTYTDEQVAQNAKKNTWYGACSTSGTTRTVTTDTGDFSLTAGNTIYVLFSYAASASTTLNVDGTGAKNIKSVATTNVAANQWGANEVVALVYDGTYFRMVDGMIASTTYYGMTKLSSSTSSTATNMAATPSAVKSAYDLANAAMPKSGGTFTDTVIAQNNTSYTTGQIRNIFLVADGATLPSGSNGDICLVYTP